MAPVIVGSWIATCLIALSQRWLKMGIQSKKKPCFYYCIAHHGLNHLRWRRSVKAKLVQEKFRKIQAHGWQPFRNVYLHRRVAFDRKKILCCDNYYWEDAGYWTLLDQCCLRYALRSVAYAARVQQWCRNVFASFECNPWCVSVLRGVCSVRAKKDGRQHLMSIVRITSAQAFSFLFISTRTCVNAEHQHAEEKSRDSETSNI